MVTCLCANEPVKKEKVDDARDRCTDAGRWER